MKKYEKYTKLKDVEIIKEIREGDEDAKNYLYDKYERWISYNTMNYKIKDCSMKEKKQILAVGFAKAINSYDPERNDNFKAYAKICMSNEMKDYIKSLRAGKRSGVIIESLYSKVSNSGDNQLQLIDIIKNDDDSPEDEFINKENEVLEILKAKGLPEIYYEVLKYKEEGKKHADIAIALDIKKTKVDYIMFKIRKILEKYKNKKFK